MTEYIEKAEAIDRAKYAPIMSSGPVDEKHIDAWMDGASDAQGCIYKLLIKMPAADVVPVVHGEWNWVGRWECSLCKHPWYIGWETPAANYCPNCGAKMDGDLYE